MGNTMAQLQFTSNVGDHNINSPNRATYCAADLRPDLVARFPERGALDPANRTTVCQDTYSGQSFAPRVAQSTWKSEDSLRQITNEYDELATAPLVTTTPGGGSLLRTVRFISSRICHI